MPETGSRMQEGGGNDAMTQFAIDFKFLCPILGSNLP